MLLGLFIKLFNIPWRVEEGGGGGLMEGEYFLNPYTQTATI